MANTRLLTEEQEEMLPAIREEWVRVGLSTEPADREAAERGIRMVYQAAGLPIPEVILWFPSPRAALALASFLRTDAIRPQVRSTVGIPVWRELVGILRSLAVEPTRYLLTAHAGNEIAAKVLSSFGTLAGGGEQPWTPIREFLHAPKRDSVWAALGRQFWLPTREAIWDRVWSQFFLNRPPGTWPPPPQEDPWPGVWSTLWQPLETEIRSLLSFRLSDHIWAGAWRHVGNLLREGLEKTWFGQQDAAWLCVYEVQSRFGLISASSPDLAESEAFYSRLFSAGPSSGIEGLMLAARSCGSWWPFPGMAICTERPSRLERDNQGRLHSSTGMALQYPDGWGLWRLGGVQVDERMVMRPETYTPGEILAEINMERRRLLLEQFGYERFIRESGAAPVDNDEYGTLYRINLRGDEPLVMVHVVNSTPEPDGSCREFFIRVPPNIHRARAAVAWTFGLEPEEYDPVRES